MSIDETVRGLLQKYAGPSFHWKRGDVVRHPNGRDIRIDDGCYLDPTYGRVSNFWYWTFLDAEGKPTLEKGHGYGW